MNIFQELWSRFRGSGHAAVTVPSMDGVLRPNNALEEASKGLELSDPANLVADGERMWLSSGHDLCRLATDAKTVEVVATFPSPISCLVLLRDGGLAIGLQSGRLVFWGYQLAGTEMEHVGGRSLRCITAGAIAPDGALVLCLGSQECGPEAWKTDLMSNHASGSIWRLDLETGDTQCLADDLAYPLGVVCLEDGSIVFSESWRHRIVVLKPDGEQEYIITDLPGYPGEMQRDPDTGDIWMSVFAPRNQLVEFVLRDGDFCAEMIASIDPKYWIAPSYYPANSYRVPLQGGALKQLGELKAWAPSWSYGFVVKLNSDLQPVNSFHSRANGRRHGIVSCLRANNRLYVASQGNAEVFELGSEII